MDQATLPVTSADAACPRCCLPEDLLPIQQAAVIRSFPSAYRTVVTGAGWDDTVRPPAPEGSSPLEHAASVGATFAAVYIRLSQLPQLEPRVPLGLVGRRQAGPDEPPVQIAISRLSDHAERLAEIIMTCARACDWQAPLSPDQPSPHALVHLAIDEAAEHLRDAGSLHLLDAPSVAVAGSSLFGKAGVDAAPRRTVRRMRERGW